MRRKVSVWARIPGRGGRVACHASTQSHAGTGRRARQEKVAHPSFPVLDHLPYRGRLPPRPRSRSYQQEATLLGVQGHDGPVAGILKVDSSSPRDKRQSPIPDTNHPIRFSVCRHVEYVLALQKRVTRTEWRPLPTVLHQTRYLYSLYCGIFISSPSFSAE